MFVLAVMATTVLATDKLLTSAGASCNDKFKQIMADNYAGDSSCQDTIKAAMTTAPTDVSQCPGGVLANVGTPVQKCMAKSQVHQLTWVLGACGAAAPAAAALGGLGLNRTRSSHVVALGP